MREDIFRRELYLMELIMKAVQVFAANIPAILTVLCVVFLPLSILQSVILDRMMTGADALGTFLTAGNLPQGQVMQLMTQTLLHDCLYLAVVLFLEPVGIIAVAKLTKQHLMQEELSAKKAMAEAIQMQPAIIVSGLLYGVLVVLGGMLTTKFLSKSAISQREANKAAATSTTTTSATTTTTTTTTTTSGDATTTTTAASAE